MSRHSWSMECSAQASRIVNPIRAIADSAKASTSSKALIKLSVGDPTLDAGYLPFSTEQQEALQAAAADTKLGGYCHCLGMPEAREAVAEYWKRYFTSTPELASHIFPQHVVMTSGGSHAIQLAITAIANPGDNVLLPSPGFPHYKTMCDTYEIESRFYRLDPEANWAPNMDDIRNLCDGKTKLLVMTNPSNPCGSNFSREQVAAMVTVAEELKLPLFSDEIYAGMVFQYEENPQKTFTSVADIPSDVPRVILAGTAKTFIVPGWRVGWLLFIDPIGIGVNYFKGIMNEAALLVGPSTIAQATVPAALLKTPATYLPKVVSIIETSAMGFYKAINSSSVSRAKAGAKWLLHATMPQASMYVMVNINLAAFSPAVATDDLVFAQVLFREENVQVVPGTAFHAPGCFRVVITRPVELLQEAAQRMVEFCERHRVAAE